MSKQNDTERVLDQFDRDLITADDANVTIVRNERFRLIRGRLPRPVRAALNKAVQSGLLGHFKKEGLMPEAYYHPTFKYLAFDARKREAAQGIEAVRRVLAINTGDLPVPAIATQEQE